MIVCFTAEAQSSQRESFFCLVAETPTRQNSSALRVKKIVFEFVFPTTNVKKAMDKDCGRLSR